MVLQSWEGAQVSYLTPAKIVILTICVLYCEGGLTEERILVMKNIVEFIDHGMINIDDPFQGELQINTIKEMLGSSTKLYKSVLNMLWTLESFDSLFDFFLKLNLYLQTPVKELDERFEYGLSSTMKLSSNSILGFFFKKCYLAFERLEFDKLIELWNEFEIYREQTRREWEKVDRLTPSINDDDLSSNPSFLAPQTPEEDSEKFIPQLMYLIGNGNNSILDTTHLTVDVDNQITNQNSSTFNLSDETLEAIFENQIDKFQYHGAILPSHIISIMDTLIQSRFSKSTPPSAYFVQYLDACKNRDHEKAFENLHRFYDYSMDSRGKSHYQYALFTLATLQAEFNSTSEAIRAAEEAIAVAHENMDFYCLTQILSWLYTYLQNNPNCDIPISLSSKEQISQFLLAKSWEISPLLSSLSFQNEALQMFSKGGESSPSYLTTIFESLVKSSYINMITNSPLMSANLYLAQSALWNRLGVDVLSDFYLNACLSMTTNITSDTLSSIASSQNSTTYLQAATIKSQKLLTQGHFTQSFDLLNSLKPLAEQSISYQHIWLPSALLLYTKQALNENRLTQARTLIDRLLGLSIVNQNISHAAQCSDIQLDILMGNCSRAIEKSIQQMEKCNELDIDILHQLKYMILYIRALCKSEQPTRAFSVTLRCFQLAQRATIYPLILESLIILTSILNSRKDYKDSISLLDAIVPKIMETGYTGLIAEMYENMAEATVGVTEGTSEMEKNALLERAFKYTIEAAKYFERENNILCLINICEKQINLAQQLGNQERLIKVNSILKTLNEQSNSNHQLNTKIIE